MPRSAAPFGGEDQAMGYYSRYYSLVCEYTMPPKDMFLDAPGGQDEEGTYISAGLSEMTAWLDDCLDKLDSGRENEIMSDPFFDSGLSDEKVDELITTIDADISKELEGHAGYHRNRSNSNAPPEYSRLGASARRALAEGCLMILQRHAAATTEQP